MILHKTNNTYVKTDGKLVATIGVNDLIITNTKDAILIADKNSVQDVKEIVKKLKADDRSEWKLPYREVYRPWGKV